jgi:hypothetical protein
MVDIADTSRDSGTSKNEGEDDAEENTGSRSLYDCNVG